MQIKVTGEAVAKLRVYKAMIVKKIGNRPVSDNELILSLLNLYSDNKDMWVRLKSAESNASKYEIQLLEVRNQLIENKELLISAITRPHSPTYSLPIGTQPIIAPNTFAPPPGPPPPLNIPELDGEIEGDFNEERKAIFDGTIRKPSDILKATQPEHAKHEVIEFVGKKPSLLKASYALENADKFRKEQKRTL